MKLHEIYEIEPKPFLHGYHWVIESPTFSKILALKGQYRLFRIFDAKILPLLFRGQ